MQQIDNVTEFVRGAARFTRIAADTKTGIQAWRRSYTFEPWRDLVELFEPQGGRYYPEESSIKRRIQANDPRLREKVSYYLENGLECWFPGDEPEGIYNHS